MTGLQILIADDNRDAADTLAHLLQLSGHQTTVAADGAQAIELAESTRPDVILMDLGMPIVNGFEAAEQIRRQPWAADIVMIALTGWGHSEDRANAKKAGFDHHLIKPVKRDQLQTIFATVKPASV